MEDPAQYLTSMPISVISSIESTFRHSPWIKWFDANWTGCFYLSFFYVLTIFGLQRYMKNRPAFKLQKPLLVWNALLATFSIVGTIRTAPELFDVLTQAKNPLYASICIKDRETETITCGFWILVFVISKAVELGDTLFIVLRKQPLIFLHWYHHITVLCYCCSTYGSFSSTGTWFLAMNFAVHSVMYSYYALKVMRVRVPKSASMCITCLQLIQMAIGVGCNLYALTMKLTGQHCATELRYICFALGMYASYFILFGHFFRQAYFRKPKTN